MISGKMDGIMAKKQRNQRPRPDTLASVIMPVFEENLELSLGNRLRELRRQQSFSLRALADKSGLSANTLSLIENGKTSPSVATLQQIALALNIPITSFFESRISREPVIHTQNGQRSPILIAHGQIEDAGAGFGLEGLQPFIVTVNPGAESTLQPISHDNLEFIYCISGQFIFNVMGKEYHLRAGDTLIISPRMLRTWRNPVEEICQLLVVTGPPEDKPKPSQLQSPL